MHNSLLTPIETHFLSVMSCNGTKFSTSMLSFLCLIGILIDHNEYTIST